MSYAGATLHTRRWRLRHVVRVGKRRWIIIVRSAGDKQGLIAKAVGEQATVTGNEHGVIVPVVVVNDDTAVIGSVCGRGVIRNQAVNVRSGPDERAISRGVYVAGPGKQRELWPCG